MCISNHNRMHYLGSFFGSVSNVPLNILVSVFYGFSDLVGKLKYRYNNCRLLWHFSYHMSYQPESPILAQGPKARGVIWVEGWYGMWYEKCHIITYLSYTTMRLSSYLWELIVFRNHVAWFGIWCNNVILYLRFYYMYLET